MGKIEKMIAESNLTHWGGFEWRRAIKRILTALNDEVQGVHDAAESDVAKILNRLVDIETIILSRDESPKERMERIRKAAQRLRRKEDHITSILSKRGAVPQPDAEQNNTCECMKGAAFPKYAGENVICNQPVERLRCDDCNAKHLRDAMPPLLDEQARQLKVLKAFARSILEDSDDVYDAAHKLAIRLGLLFKSQSQFVGDMAATRLAPWLKEVKP